MYIACKRHVGLQRRLRCKWPAAERVYHSGLAGLMRHEQQRPLAGGAHPRGHSAPPAPSPSCPGAPGSSGTASPLQAHNAATYTSASTDTPFSCPRTCLCIQLSFRDKALHHAFSQREEHGLGLAGVHAGLHHNTHYSPEVVRVVGDNLVQGKSRLQGQGHW